MNNEILIKAVNKIKDIGYKVYIPNDEEPHTYAHYSDGTNIAYIQVEYFQRGIEISTVHMPNIKSGTGYQVFGGDTAIQPEDLTKEQLEQGFAIIPKWANTNWGNIDTPKKYTLTNWLENEWSGKRAIEV